MKRQIWKRSALLVMLGMALVTASACSSTPAKPTADAGDKAVAVSTDKYEPKKDQKYELSWTYYQLEPTADNAILKKYWEDKFNVKINVVNIDYKNYDQIINLKVASGEIPDRLRVQSNAQLISYYKQGVAMGVPIEVVQKYAPNLWKKLEQTVPKDQMNSCCIRDGKVIAIPDTANPMYRNPIVWRGDWLKKLGITKTPETLKEFEEAIYKMANNDPDGNGKKDTYGISRSGFSAVFGAFGIPWDYSSTAQGTVNWQVKDGKLVYSPIQPEAKQALTLLAKWYKDGVIDPEFITGENTGGYWALSQAFINGRIGFTSHGQTYHWSPRLGTAADDIPGQDIQEMEKINPQAAKEVIMGDAPIGPDGKRGVWTNPIVKGGGYMFGKGFADQPDKLGKYLQMIDYAYASDDNWYSAVDGIKGTMWDYVDKEDIYGHKHKVAQLIGDYKSWNGTNKLNANFGHTAMNMFSPITTDSATYEWHKQIKGDQFHLESALLAPLPSEAKYKAELTKIQDKAYISFITGEKSLDTFDDFVKQWQAAGGSQLEKEANEWYSSK